MLRFSSNREKHLWLAAAVVLIAVYSTLGLASSLVDFLKDQGLAVAAFLTGFGLVIAAIVTQAFRVRPGGVEIGIGIGIAAVYLLVFSRMTIPEERSHLIEYSVVALFIYEALKERIKNGLEVPIPELLTVGLTALFGTLDECIQAFLPSRVFDLIDILFNFLAGVMAVSAGWILGKAREKFSKTTNG